MVDLGSNEVLSQELQYWLSVPSAGRRKEGFFILGAISQLSLLKLFLFL